MWRMQIVEDFWILVTNAMQALAIVIEQVINFCKNKVHTTIEEIREHLSQ